MPAQPHRNPSEAVVHSLSTNFIGYCKPRLTQGTVIIPFLNLFSEGEGFILTQPHLDLSTYYTGP